MSTSDIRSLLNQLTGQRVKVSTRDSTVTGTVAAVTNDLLVLCSDDNVIYVNIEDIVTVTVLAD